MAGLPLGKAGGSIDDGKMLEFNANHPFPMVDFERVPYHEILRHSQRVDAWLGFDFEEIERRLMEVGCRARPPAASREHQQLWLGLAVQSLLTPYVELRALLERLKPRPGQTTVDLGAAYGRMAFVVERHFANVNFIGYEYVGERVTETKRVMKKQGIVGSRLETLMQHRDLSLPGFAPQPADIYFIYDYGTPKAIEKTLYDLKRTAQAMEAAGRSFTLVARGRHCRMLIDARHPWLTPVDPDEPEGRVTLYRTLPAWKAKVHEKMRADIPHADAQV